MTYDWYSWDGWRAQPFVLTEHGHWLARAEEVVQAEAAGRAAVQVGWLDGQQRLMRVDTGVVRLSTEPKCTADWALESQPYSWSAGSTTNQKQNKT